MDLFADVNWLSVVVAGLASMMLGMIWYGKPLFGNAWIKLAGISESDMKKGGTKMMVTAMLLGFVGTLLTALVLAYFVGEADINAALMTALIVWLGFYLPVDIGTVIWQMKPWKLFFIYTGYNIVNLAIIATILTYVQ